MRLVYPEIIVPNALKMISVSSGATIFSVLVRVAYEFWVG